MVRRSGNRVSGRRGHIEAPCGSASRRRALRPGLNRRVVSPRGAALSNMAIQGWRAMVSCGAAPSGLERWRSGEGSIGHDGDEAPRAQGLPNKSSIARQTSPDPASTRTLAGPPPGCATCLGRGGDTAMVSGNMMSPYRVPDVQIPVQSADVGRNVVNSARVTVRPVVWMKFIKINLQPAQFLRDRETSSPWRKPSSHITRTGWKRKAVLGCRSRNATCLCFSGSSWSCAQARRPLVCERSRTGRVRFPVRRGFGAKIGRNTSRIFHIGVLTDRQRWHRSTRRRRR